MNLHDKTAQIPERLENLLLYETTCGCGRKHVVELAQASIRRGALEDVVPFAKAIAGHTDVAVIVDQITQGVCGENVGRVLSADGQRVRMCVIPDGAGHRQTARVHGEVGPKR